MNWEKLKEYIESFDSYADKKFTKEELIKIGLAHKELPVRARNWATLTDFIGYKGSPDSLRKKVQHFQSQYLKKEEIPAGVNVKTSLDNLKKTDPTFDTNKIQKKIEDLYIQQTKVKDSFNSYRRTLRDEARIQTLKETITECAKVLPLLPEMGISLLDHHKNTSSEAVLLFSDLHIGNECENFYNKYNIEIAIERVKKLAKEVLNYCKLHDIQKLNILNLGDMIQGIIHINSRIEQEIDVVQQVMVAAEIVSNALLNNLEYAAPIVTYRSVVDNHSRMSPNKLEHIEKENLAILIDWFIEERLKVKKSPILFVHDNIDNGIGTFTLLNGKNVVFAHGHEDSKKDVFQHFIGATQKFYDYAFLGHYHNLETKWYQDLKVVINGSIIGTDQFALSHRLFAKPAQKLLIFKENNNDLIDISISLE